MHDRLQIDYLATFDTGNASIRWPQKNASKANQSQYLFDAEAIAGIKSNLLFKPFISIRHFELFDNLALARFFSANRQILTRLSEARLIRVCSRLAQPWEEICRDWALQNPDEPMHWHHLTPARQSTYDIASKKHEIRDLQTLGSHLWLGEFSDVNRRPLNLNQMIALYDDVFPPHEIIVTNPGKSPGPLYSNLVERELEEYLRQRREPSGRLPDVLLRIEEEVRKCCSAGVRRRQFYTRLDGLAHELRESSRRTPKKLNEEVFAIEAFVINEAFYKEFQGFSRYECGSESGRAHIVANRDITESWIPASVALLGPAKQEIEEYLENETLPIIEAITFEDILDWRTASHTEALSFRASLYHLQQVFAQQSKNRNDSEVAKAAKQHIQNLSACIQRSFSDSRKDLLKAPWTEVYFGANPELAARMITDGLASQAARLKLDPHLISAMSHATLTLLFKKKAKSYALRHFETVQEKQLRDSVPGRLDVD